MDALRWQIYASERSLTSTDSKALREQFMTKQGKGEIRRLSDFLMEFMKHGEFTVWDFSQRTIALSNENANLYISYVKEIPIKHGPLEGDPYGIKQPKS